MTARLVFREDNAASLPRLRVEMAVYDTGEGIIVHLTGGDKPHVGAVVLSIPRPSLTDAGRLSCNSYVLPVLGHRDDELAREVGEMLCRRLGQRVVVVAGIHVEGAGTDEIEKVVAGAVELAERFLMVCKGEL